MDDAPSPSPWPTEIVCIPAWSRPRAMTATCSGVKRWPIAFAPSRRVESVSRTRGLSLTSEERPDPADDVVLIVHLEHQAPLVEHGARVGDATPQEVAHGERVARWEPEERVLVVQSGDLERAANVAHGTGAGSGHHLGQGE